MRVFIFVTFLTLMQSAMQGAIIIGVDAEGASGFIEADSSQLDPSAKVASGYASSAVTGAIAFVREGGSAYCPSHQCGSIGSSPSGVTVGIVDMTEGSIKAFAKAVDGGGAASSTFSFTDVITFGPSKIIKFNLDLPNISHTGPGEGSSDIFLQVMEHAPQGQTPLEFFQFQAHVAFDGSFYSQSGIAGAFGSPGPIPNSFEFVLDFEQFPFPFLLPDPLPIVVTLSMGTQCGGPCTAFVRADSSLYTSIAPGYISQNGYSYLGVTPDGQVPEPSTMILLIAGLVLLAAARRRNIPA